MIIEGSLTEIQEQINLQYSVGTRTMSITSKDAVGITYHTDSMQDRNIIHSPSNF